VSDDGTSGFLELSDDEEKQILGGTGVELVFWPWS